MSDMVLDGRGTRLVVLHGGFAARLRRDTLYRNHPTIRIVRR